jgi:ribosomal protein S18 acetylase RimI-like enzyme
MISEETGVPVLRRTVPRCAAPGTRKSMTIVRPAEAAELDHLAQLWHDAWRDGHAKIAPAGLVAARTVARFRERLAAMLADVGVIGPVGAPLGFCALKGDELYQLFVARAARGSGVADALLDDGEARLAARGYKTTWLACGVGNDRAARFYEKRGWTRARTVTNRADTPEGVLEFEIWRYEKPLTV